MSIKPIKTRGKRFHITNGNVVCERTGRHEFDEPVATFANRKLAKLFCDVMNKQWEEKQRKLNAPKCGNDGTKWNRDHCVYGDNGKCIHCGGEVPY